MQLSLGSEVDYRLSNLYLICGDEDGFALATASSIFFVYVNSCYLFDIKSRENSSCINHISQQTRHSLVNYICCQVARVVVLMPSYTGPTILKQKNIYVEHSENSDISLICIPVTYVFICELCQKIKNVGV